MDEEINFQKIENSSGDVILAIDHNLYGNRVVLASSDHFLRVYEKSNAQWTLIDSWRGHASEILQVRVQVMPALAGPCIIHYYNSSSAFFFTRKENREQSRVDLRIFVSLTGC